MSGYRPSYTIDEDNRILKGIIDSQLYYSLRGRSFWKDLSAVGYLDRTWMSLQNHFEKYILPNISNPKYNIPELEKRKIELGWHQTSAIFKKNYKKNEKDINDSDKNSSSSEEIDVESSSIDVDNDSSSEDEIVIDDTDKPEDKVFANSKVIQNRDTDHEGLQSSDESLIFALNTTISMIDENIDKQTTQMDDTNVTKSNSNDFTTFMEFEKSNIQKHVSDNNMKDYEITDDEGDIFLTCEF